MIVVPNLLGLVVLLGGAAILLPHLGDIFGPDPAPPPPPPTIINVIPSNNDSVLLGMAIVVGFIFLIGTVVFGFLWYRERTIRRIQNLPPSIPVSYSKAEVEAINENRAQKGEVPILYSDGRHSPVRRRDYGPPFDRS